MKCKNRFSKEEAFRLLRTELQKTKARLTSPRALILDAALTIEPNFTAEELFRKLDGKVDLATVYRNLSLFFSIGLVAKVDIYGDRGRYELASKDKDHHHHYIVCNSCGKSEAIETCSVHIVEKNLKRTGFKNISHRLEFTGVCANC